MAADDKLYDPQSVTVVFGTHIVQGFAENSMIKAKRNARSFSIKIGCKGEGTRTRNANKSGEVEIYLMQTSESNAFFSATLAADEASPNGAGILPLMVKDNSGYSVCWAEKAWLVAPPEPDLGKEPTQRTWIFETTKLNIVEGGN